MYQISMVTLEEDIRPKIKSVYEKNTIEVMIEGLAYCTEVHDVFLCIDVEERSLKRVVNWAGKTEIYQIVDDRL